MWYLACKHLTIFNLHLQGTGILQVVKSHHYQVQIGNETCFNVSVTMSEITCLPPTSQPFDSTSDHATVKVISGNFLLDSSKLAIRVILMFTIYMHVTESRSNCNSPDYI